MDVNYLLNFYTGHLLGTHIGNINLNIIRLICAGPHWRVSRFPLFTAWKSFGPMASKQP